MPIVVRICAVSAACAAAFVLQSASAFAADLPNAPSNYPALDDEPGRAGVESVVGALCRHGDLGLGRQGGQGRGRGRGLSRLRPRLRQRRRRRGEGVERLRALPLVDPERLHAVHRNRLRRRRGDRRLSDGAGDALCDRRRRPRPADPFRLRSARSTTSTPSSRARAPSRRSARSASASPTASTTTSASASRRSCTPTRPAPSGWPY